MMERRVFLSARSKMLMKPIVAFQSVADNTALHSDLSNSVHQASYNDIHHATQNHVSISRLPNTPSSHGCSTGDSEERSPVPGTDALY